MTVPTAMWDGFPHVSHVPLHTTIMLLLNPEFTSFKQRASCNSIRKYKQLSHWRAGNPILDVSEMFCVATVYGALDTDHKSVRSIALI